MCTTNLYGVMVSLGHDLVFTRTGWWFNAQAGCLAYELVSRLNGTPSGNSVDCSSILVWLHIRGQTHSTRYPAGVGSLLGSGSAWLAQHLHQFSGVAVNISRPAG